MIGKRYAVYCDRRGYLNADALGVDRWGAPFGALRLFDERAAALERADALGARVEVVSVAPEEQ